MADSLVSREAYDLSRTSLDEDLIRAMARLHRLQQPRRPPPNSYEAYPKWTEGMRSPTHSVTQANLLLRDAANPYGVIGLGDTCGHGTFAVAAAEPSALQTYVDLLVQKYTQTPFTPVQQKLMLPELATRGQRTERLVPFDHEVFPPWGNEHDDARDWINLDGFGHCYQDSVPLVSMATYPPVLAEQEYLPISPQWQDTFTQENSSRRLVAGKVLASVGVQADEELDIGPYFSPPLVEQRLPNWEHFDDDYEEPQPILYETAVQTDYDEEFGPLPKFERPTPSASSASTPIPTHTSSSSVAPASTSLLRRRQQRSSSISIDPTSEPSSSRPPRATGVRIQGQCYAGELIQVRYTYEKGSNGAAEGLTEVHWSTSFDGNIWTKVVKKRTEDPLYDTFQLAAEEFGTFLRCTVYVVDQQNSKAEPVEVTGCFGIAPNWKQSLTRSLLNGVESVSILKDGNKPYRLIFTSTNLKIEKESGRSFCGLKSNAVVVPWSNEFRIVADPQNAAMFTIFKGPNGWLTGTVVGAAASPSSNGGLNEGGVSVEYHRTRLVLLFRLFCAMADVQAATKALGLDAAALWTKKGGYQAQNPTDRQLLQKSIDETHTREMPQDVKITDQLLNERYQRVCLDGLSWFRNRMVLEATVARSPSTTSTP